MILFRVKCYVVFCIGIEKGDKQLRKSVCLLCFLSGKTVYFLFFTFST